MSPNLLKFYYKRSVSKQECNSVSTKIKNLLPVTEEEVKIDTEVCYYVDVEEGCSLSPDDEKQLCWILSESFRAQNLRKEPWLEKTEDAFLIEVGPRLNFSTPWSTNAVGVCHSVGLNTVTRIEQSKRFLISLKGYANSKDEAMHLKRQIEAILHDKMTESVYVSPLDSFDFPVQTTPVYEVDVMEKGMKALEQVNEDLGLSFDARDLEFYTKLFKVQLKRNPTSVECFDLAQSNSEHSRHWFFKGHMIIDGREMSKSLMELVMSTQKDSNDNNVIKFCDNSSAIQGYDVATLKPKDPTTASEFRLQGNRKRHITFTAETHNFPTGVAPFPGATTGTGGRIRDNHAAGRGAHVIAGSAGYCFGNLNIPGYKLPWEEDGPYPTNFAMPLDVAIEASNGASDYGNKFGEPVITGFSRSFGLKDRQGSRKEWIKPIMFSGGIGAIEDCHVNKQLPEKGMKVLKVGGPVYRIGVGGGAASSVNVQGDNAEALDFGAVQRGDAEMEQKLNRLIRACIELDENNPICSIHDQGAGGNGNVLKEIVEPAGATIYSKAFEKGDPTISTLELWGAEYQENDALLVKERDCELMKKIGKREKVPVCIVGDISGNGRIILDDSASSQTNGHEIQAKRGKFTHPVDLPLDVVLGKMPPKTFNLQECDTDLTPLKLPENLTLREALDRVLRLPSVGSKRYLTNKVDRCVTGLVAQQQCVGPVHTPLADVAVVALSHFDTVGAATAIGEQPIKGLVNPARGARMSLGEALTNLVFAQITTLKDVKCSGNWMWPAKLNGEGARLYRACQALCDAMKAVGVAIDGGKDSLSMAARVGDQVVKSPGAIVVSAYAPCPDITKTITPDLKCPGKGILLWVNLSCNHARLGGSALAQVFKQIGDHSPDMDNPELLVRAFEVTQSLISKRILKAGHDISDGGLIVAALEMAFSGNCGIKLNLHTSKNIDGIDHKSRMISQLFAEELGLILEVLPEHEQEVIQTYARLGVPCCNIGSTGTNAESSEVVITFDNDIILRDSMVNVRFLWESTSFQLERLQANPQCVAEEEASLRFRKEPMFKLSFTPKMPVNSQFGHLNQAGFENRPRVAVIREEGSNGDREMVSSLVMAGFSVWDVTMTDLCSGAITLDQFRGVVFVGGFSYADVLGSAKGWAAVARFNERARRELEQFRLRRDTFSLGVCNGCQLMGLLGWVGSDDRKSFVQETTDMNQGGPAEGVCFTHNKSGRFECRFVSVKINKTSSIMMQGMEDSLLGIWVAHGEGRVEFASDRLKREIASKQLIPLQYVDDNGIATEGYPFNPNGSPNGIAALCSPDGRHLAMMPHPERTTLKWQWPWMPAEWRNTLTASPWLQMFHNAFSWCSK